MTYDFIMHAWNDEEFMSKLLTGMEQNEDCEVCTECHRITFHSDIHKIDVFPLSETSPFHWKIMPMQITYSALYKMLNKDFEHFEHDDIVIIL